MTGISLEEHVPDAVFMKKKGISNKLCSNVAYSSGRKDRINYAVRSCRMERSIRSIRPVGMSSSFSMTVIMRSAGEGSGSTAASVTVKITVKVPTLLN